jgi:hypothetical protein
MAFEQIKPAAHKPPRYFLWGNQPFHYSKWISEKNIDHATGADT